MCPWFDSWRYHKAESRSQYGIPQYYHLRCVWLLIEKAIKAAIKTTRMNTTLFGCYFTDPWVSPADWKTTTSKKSLQKEWYVQCYFYDPAFKDKYPYGKPYRKRFNKFNTLETRRAAAEFYLSEIPKLFNAGYNHISGKYMSVTPEPEPENDKLSPLTPALTAIEKTWELIRSEALNKLPEAERVKAKPYEDVKVAKNRFIKGLSELKYDTTPIKDLKLSDIKETIVYLKITDGYYNKFLSYMSKIYTELIEYGCVENNPFKLYKKKKAPQKIREVLEDDEFIDVMDYLHDRHYHFYRYGMIFHLSGARSTELMLVKKKAVNIQNQEYKVWIKKGDRYVEEIKVILPEAIPFWEEVLSECNSNEDYLFSYRFKPGPVAVAARQVSRKWKKYIKVGFNEGRDKKITADFYSLKHLFLDRLAAMQFESNAPDNLAQAMASHRTPTVTNAVYLVNKKKREREVLKNTVVYKQQKATG